MSGQFSKGEGLGMWRASNSKDDEDEDPYGDEYHFPMWPKK